MCLCTCSIGSSTDFAAACGETMQKLAVEKDAKSRLYKDPTATGMTVEGFIEKIISQCKAVLDKHERKGVDDYLNDGLNRTLELEMLDVKVSTCCSQSGRVPTAFYFWGKVVAEKNCGTEWSCCLFVGRPWPCPSLKSGWRIKTIASSSFVSTPPSAQFTAAS